MKNKTISFSPPDITEAEIKEVAEAPLTMEQTGDSMQN